MQNPVTSFKRFLRSFGPVEQAQVVASTAVVVMMITIISILVATGQSFRFIDFFTVVSVGLIGFTSVYFTLRYSRQLESQRRQLLALNTIADTVNRFGELSSVVNTALEKVIDVLQCDFVWIYVLEGERLALKSSRGTSLDFMAVQGEQSPFPWIHQPIVEREKLSRHGQKIHPSLKKLGIQYWVSLPLSAKETVAGTLVVAGRNFDMLTVTEAELMESFGKQISVALNNARLFDLLRKSEQRYLDLFENAPDSYLTVGRTRVIESCNRTGAEILGYPREEILGRTFEELFAPDRAADVRQLLEAMFLAGKGINDIEQQMVTRTGETVCVNLNFSLAFNEAGQTINARVIARDITDRKKMEHAILHAQKIESIGKLAGGVAHDFNNILASVLGSASILRRKLTEKSQFYKYIEIIEIAARRGSSLTRQLLAFARKNETRDELVEVNELIRETILMYERSVPKNIVVDVRLTEEFAHVRGDSGQIQQALLNLLLNAREAMPDGGTVTVVTTIVLADAHTTAQYTSVKPGPFVRVDVSDTGVGMKHDDRLRVFEPFYTTKETGTGLGLSVVYGVVQNHGGFLDIHSEPGQGTSLSVYLPRSNELQRAIIQQRQQRVPRGKEHILMIDDEISVCEIARDLLSELGYLVTVAHDGKEGVDLFRGRQTSIDLVLLDLNMPLMAGKETFEMLRSINPKLCIIILTGYGESIMEQEMFSGEVNSFIQKPFQPEDLAIRIRQVLDARQAAEEMTN